MKKKYDKGLKYETLTAEMQLQSSEIKYSQRVFHSTHNTQPGVLGSPQHFSVGHIHRRLEFLGVRDRGGELPVARNFLRLGRASWGCWNWTLEKNYVFLWIFMGIYKNGW